MQVEILHIVDAIVSESDVRGKTVLEVGSRNVNGTVRSVMEKYHPLSYIGIDIEEGDGVDQICNIYDLVSEFREDQFDIVMCMETLEHVEDWRSAISNLKNVLRRGGTMILSAPIPGRKYHGYPFDFWRYTKEDWRFIFQDMDIVYIQDILKTVILKVRKPLSFKEADLSNMKLYSVKK